MRKPRGVQIRANRLIGPGKCLVGTIDECPPRGEVVQRPTEAAQEPRGSGPLPSTPARARGSSVRATPSLHPPRILKTISLFYRKEDPEKSRLRGRLQLFFLSLVWGFPIVAAGIPFVVDHQETKALEVSQRGAVDPCRHILDRGSDVEDDAAIRSTEGGGEGAQSDRGAGVSSRFQLLAFRESGHEDCDQGQRISRFAEPLHQFLAGELSV